eukprot:CAMPEP_0174854188 /NCGR_PEP_ID=MMETSP1114-20130205/30293_1 /TAXON_ID=312471 /ORGANISM="Neobodo designis, Strain CCAP 1951/1" /LENGTH=197 /DNA_ID=CAMNT_0016088867 /DNA_START=172 /DNA_END=761 /DNA_ORIENTATION=-
MPSDETISGTGRSLGNNYQPGKKTLTADQQYPVQRDVFFGSVMLVIVTVLMGASSMRERYDADDKRRQEMAEQVAAAAIVRAVGGAPNATTYGVEKSTWRDDDVVIEAAVQEIAGELALALAAIVAPQCVPGLAEQIAAGADTRSDYVVESVAAAQRRLQEQQEALARGVSLEELRALANGTSGVADSGDAAAACLT